MNASQQSQLYSSELLNSCPHSHLGDVLLDACTTYTSLPPVEEVRDPLPPPGIVEEISRSSPVIPFKHVEIWLFPCTNALAMVVVRS
ncbi:hypothetical protein TIFTF001_009340 [Ficus carica]|uniref:Uncharacterized protein n=1 Tax=Ficus carica TaxID=3494 RepID=A0AA87ZUD9_FICCA|nr:hypothetical protein TIFTF001_009340 [Ficus carica]